MGKLLQWRPREMSTVYELGLGDYKNLFIYKIIISTWSVVCMCNVANVGLTVVTVTQ